MIPFTIERRNRMGVKYVLTAIDELTTKIETPHNGKSIVVEANIDYLSTSWYKYTKEGQFVQTAFPFLSDGEREFIITGLTPMEWDELWQERD